MSEQTTNTDTQSDADVVAGAVAADTNTDTTTDSTTEGGWSYAEGVKGEGDAPEWLKTDKYSSVADQAKGYKELESKLGSFTGSPESFDVIVSDSLKEKGVDILSDDPMVEEAIKFAKESNMSQDGFNGMVDLYATVKLAESESIEQTKADEIKALGDNAQGRLDNINAWAKTNLPTDLFEGVQEMATSAKTVQALEKLIAMTRSAPISSEDVQARTGSVSEEDLRKMQFEKDDNGNRRMQTDPAFKAKFKKMADQVWGGEDHRIVIGS